MSGQYNDEYNDIAHEKMGSKHYVPRQKPIAWRSTPLINNLPGSCDDEYFEEYNIFMSVDLGMVRNAAANALSALANRTLDEEVDVTEKNCIRVSLSCVVSIELTFVTMCTFSLNLSLLNSLSLLIRFDKEVGRYSIGKGMGLWRSLLWNYPICHNCMFRI